MFIEKTFGLVEFYNVYGDDKSIYIFCEHRDERGDFKNKINRLNHITSTILILEFNNYENITVRNMMSGINLNLTTHNFQNYISSIVTDDMNIIVDMTDMDTKLLAILLSHIRKMKFYKLFMMYSYPVNYLSTNISREEDNIGDLNESLIREFKLNDYYKGVESIPTYFHIDIDYESKKQIWVVFLGFDRNRTNTLDESKEIEKTIIPIITFPSARPGWDKNTFDANFDFLVKNELSHKVVYTSFSSPFQTYRLLEKINEDYCDDHLIISPLGVKPTTLGVLLFILNNPRVELLFDNPIIKHVRSVGTLDTNIYDVTDYIRGKND